MQPRPGIPSKKTPKIIVDPRPPKNIQIKKPKPPSVKPIIVKPIKRGGLDKPFPMPGIDDKIVRTMPITQKQLGQIKKMYKI